MAHIREKTRLVNQAIVEAYYEEGMSYSALEKKFGRSINAISKLIKLDREQNGERERKSKPVDPRRLDGRQPLSFTHASIGMLVDRYMAQHNLTPTAFGMLGRVNKSRPRVREIAAGVYDLTLTDISALSEVLGVSFEAMVCPPQKERQLVTGH